MAANAENSPTDFSITILELQSYENLTSLVLFENRNVSVASGTIRDMVIGFGTHVYRICYSSVNGPPSIHPSNILRNPSFENQSNVGMADSMWPTLGERTNSALVDPTEASHGYYSQRLTNANGASFINVTSYIAALAPEVAYRVSFVVKSSADVSVFLYSSCSDLQQSFSVLKKQPWKECVATIQLSSPAQCSFSIGVRDQSSVWIDLFQVFDPASD